MRSRGRACCRWAALAWLQLHPCGPTAHSHPSSRPPPLQPPCSEAGLRALSRLPLRALILSACCQLTDGCLLAIARGLPQLECLGLFEAGEGVTDEGLAHLAALGGSLTALDLGYSCWSHSEAGLAALLARMRRLRMLNIGACCRQGWAVGGAAAAPLLLLAACCGAACARATCLTPQPPRLPCSAGGCEGATDAVVATVARCCSELRELDVSECQRMSAAAVRQLGQVRRGRARALGRLVRPPLGDARRRTPAAGSPDATLLPLALLPLLRSCPACKSSAW